MRTTLVATFLLLAASTGVSARSFHVTTRAGAPVQVMHEASWDRSCQPTGGPDYQFSPPPQHGTLSEQPVSSVITTCGAGGCECKGRPITAKAVYYTPEPSFRGTDRFGIVSTFPNGVVLNHNASVMVR